MPKESPVKPQVETARKLRCFTQYCNVIVEILDTVLVKRFGIGRFTSNFLIFLFAYPCVHPIMSAH